MASSWKKHRVVDFKTPKSSIIMIDQKHSLINLKGEMSEIKFKENGRAKIEYTSV